MIATTLRRSVTGHLRRFTSLFLFGLASATLTGCGPSAAEQKAKLDEIQKSADDRVAQAQKQAKDQIAAVQKVSAETSGAIQGIGKTIDEVTEISTSIAAAMEQQGASTREISRNVAQAASGTQEMATTMVRVATTAGRSGAASTELLHAAEDLSRRSGALQSQVTGFLGALKTA